MRSNTPFSLSAAKAHGERAPDIEITLRPRGEGTSALYRERVLRGHIRNGAGQPSIAVYQVRGGVLLDCHNTDRRVEFVVGDDGSWIECYPHEGAAREDIELWLFGLVLSFILQGRGIYTLHASAVTCQGSAVAFLGSNGWGKSTLAFFFLRQGHELLTDDVLPIVRKGERFFAVPAAPTMNLWPQTVSELARGQGTAGNSAKRRYSAKDLRVRLCKKEVPVGRLYLLCPAPDEREKIQITSLPPARALLELLAYTRANSMIDPVGQKELLKLYAGLVARVRLLTYPRGFAHLPEVYAAVVAESAR